MTTSTPTRRSPTAWQAVDQRGCGGLRLDYGDSILPSFALKTDYFGSDQRLGDEPDGREAEGLSPGEFALHRWRRSGRGGGLAFLGVAAYRPSLTVNSVVILYDAAVAGDAYSQNTAPGNGGAALGGGFALDLGGSQQGTYPSHRRSSSPIWRSVAPGPPGYPGKSDRTAAAAGPRRAAGSASPAITTTSGPTASPSSSPAATSPTAGPAATPGQAITGASRPGGPAARAGWHPAGASTCPTSSGARSPIREACSPATSRPAGTAAMGGPPRASSSATSTALSASAAGLRRRDLLHDGGQTPRREHRHERRPIRPGRPGHDESDRPAVELWRRRATNTLTLDATSNVSGNTATFPDIFATTVIHS